MQDCEERFFTQLIDHFNYNVCRHGPLAINMCPLSTKWLMRRMAKACICKDMATAARTGTFEGEEHIPAAILCLQTQVLARPRWADLLLHGK
jgi:hypothetical protein